MDQERPRMYWKIGLKVSLALVAVDALYVFAVSVATLYGSCTADSPRTGLDIPMVNGPSCTIKGFVAMLVFMTVIPIFVFWWQVLLALTLPVIPR